MKKTVYFLTFLLLIAMSCKQSTVKSDFNTQRADSVLALMTLEEKIGQMAQLSGHFELTGILDTNVNLVNEVVKGRAGSMLNITGAKYTRDMQKFAVENSRLGIPLLFGYDVIHGYKTIFPIPLGESASWDLEEMKNAARVAALEASAAGLHWTFAPMMDVSRDARWGRGMEGAGEDTWYNTEVAIARIRGFQGNDLSDINTVAACAKHYAGYGWSEGGRDYNYTEISDRTLRETILPPFKASVEAGVATFMTSFNDVNGVPASGNKQLGDILRKEWQYEGMVVSDWASIGELKVHGIAKDNKEAAVLGLDAAIDLDMEGHVYTDALKELVEQGIVPESKIDDAARRILKLKFDLGLFEDPYKYCDEQREKEITLSKENREAARTMAKKSIVLLKNESKVLPLSNSISSIALIGPLADNTDDILGPWRARGKAENGVSVLSGLKTRYPNAKINYALGCDFQSEDKSGFAKAVSAAKKSDVVLLAVGESTGMSGEGNSRTDIGLPGVQLDLLKEIKKTGKPVVVILMNGRPMAIPEVIELSDALLETWFLGTEAGNAIADVVSGDYNPAGKLTVTFPNTSGQAPFYYNERNTGRPGNPRRYSSKYIDAPIEPLFPFGFGLCYTSFEYSDLQLSKQSIGFDEELKITITVKNTGDYDGEEVVQLYIRDIFGSVSRPVKELKGFEKVLIKKGESKLVEFIIDSDDLAFWNRDMEYTAEPGDFKLMVGTSSVNYIEDGFTLVQ